MPIVVEGTTSKSRARPWWALAPVGIVLPFAVSFVHPISFRIGRNEVFAFLRPPNPGWAWQPKPGAFYFRSRLPKAAAAEPDWSCVGVSAGGWLYTIGVTDPMPPGR